jgi:septal ring factor EnvC (AmiA/AmiB activator)
MRIIAILSLFFCWAQAETVSREQLSELHKIRTDIKNAVFDQARYQQDILKSELDIENQNQEIQKNETEASEIKDKILDRIATVYKMKRVYPEGSWLSYAKEDDFLRKSYYLNYLNGQDKKLVTEYKTKTANTTKLKSKVQSYMKKLKSLQKENDARFAELKARETRQRELVRLIREEVKSHEPHTENPQTADAKKAADTKKFFSELRGQLDLPLKGDIKGEIGITRDRKTKLTQLKTGLTLASTVGAEVQSIYDGEVLFTDSIPGWGPTIIVDHGESYYSLYSHVKNLSVRPGDRVMAHQKLAEVSALAYHKSITDPGLYFEIRHYSEPEDPRAWLKGAHP